MLLDIGDYVKDVRLKYVGEKSAIFNDPDVTVYEIKENLYKVTQNGIRIDKFGRELPTEIPIAVGSTAVESLAFAIGPVKLK